MDAPLTPNTSAFLNYLSSTMQNSTPNPFEQANDSSFTFDNNAFKVANNNPTSLPPSAFFPMPGRDTPEDTPPSSNEPSLSPDNDAARNRNPSATGGEVSEDSGAAGSRRQSLANHKRKAGHGTAGANQDDEEDDSESDFDEGHEDKRAHPSAKPATAGAGSGRKGGRKSVGEDGKTGKDTSKAAKRKEQNRAAQKAFRERREAKVTDLEEKVRELEAKSYGASVENENLRGILKRLQEENVRLRQSAFTFTMPVNGSPTGNGNNVISNANNSGSGTNTPKVPNIQQAKPPTPPHSTSDDALRSVHELPSRKSSDLVTMGESPESLQSIGSGNGNGDMAAQPTVNLFNFNDPTNAFNAGALGKHGTLEPSSEASSSTAFTSPTSNQTPQSSSSNGKTEIEALWSGYLQDHANKSAAPSNQANAWNYDPASSFTMLSSQPASMSFVNDDMTLAALANNITNTNNGISGGWDKNAFRDTTGVSNNVPQVPAPQQPQQPQQQNDPWAGLMDNSMNDFLASLNGGDASFNMDGDFNGDDDFNAQIQKILGAGASPSAPFNLPNGKAANVLSPSNYLNMSPSPIASGSGSNGPSPQVLSSASNSASPESSYNTGASSSTSVTKSPPAAPGQDETEHVYLVDESGKVIKPSDLWVKMGMQHEFEVEHLLIDDLCDQMRTKATCKDGKSFLKASDAETMFKYRGGNPDHDKRMQRIFDEGKVSETHFACPRR